MSNMVWAPLGVRGIFSVRICTTTGNTIGRGGAGNLLCKKLHNNRQYGWQGGRGIFSARICTTGNTISRVQGRGEAGQRMHGIAGRALDQRGRWE